MTYLQAKLELDRCPHCNIDTPNLKMIWGTRTANHAGHDQRFWKVYTCDRCGGLVTASAYSDTGNTHEIYPETTEISGAIPDKARNYLEQASNSLHAPAGSVMLSASAVDAMLKHKGYKDGSLFERINKAAKDHLITDEMAKWAHQVRLDANDQRHADEKARLPDGQDAKNSLEFSKALAEILFVLPSKVTKGIATSQLNPASTNES